MVGACLLRLLAQRGWRVLALTRKPPLQSDGSVEWQRIDPASAIRIGEVGGDGAARPTHKAAPDTHVDAIDHWICVAPIWVLPDYFEMLEARGARRVVALSSTSRFTKADSFDLAERGLAAKLGAAEASLQAWAEARGIEWVILRPTLIYGCGLDKNVSMIAGFIRRFGFFPILGAAHGMRQPVHAEDVAAACLGALEAPAAANRDYNISGDEILSYREMVTRIFAALGRRPVLLSVPLVIFRLGVVCLRLFPRFRRWSPAMAQRMNRDMAFSHDAAANDLNFRPRPFALSEFDLPR